MDFDSSAVISAKDMQAAVSKLADDDGRFNIDPDQIEADLARLVLSLMAFLREILELQAIRRMENGTLSEDEEDRVGTALMRAEKAIHDMAERFGLRPEDLCLDLGPLGRTM